MSELMDDAIINMPFELAMRTELSRLQYYSRSKSLLKELEELRANKLLIDKVIHNSINRPWSRRIEIEIPDSSNEVGA